MNEDFDIRDDMLKAREEDIKFAHTEGRINYLLGFIVGMFIGWLIAMIITTWT